MQSCVTIKEHFNTPDWDLKSFVLQTRHIPKSHTGANCALMTAAAWCPSDSMLIASVKSCCPGRLEQYIQQYGYHRLFCGKPQHSNWRRMTLNPILINPAHLFLKVSPWWPSWRCWHHCSGICQGTFSHISAVGWERGCRVQTRYWHWRSCLSIALVKISPSWICNFELLWRQNILHPRHISANWEGLWSESSIFAPYFVEFLNIFVILHLTALSFN